MRLRRGLLLPFRSPALWVFCACYSGLLYVANLQAGFFDVHSPFWVLSVAFLLLLSPVFHALLIPAIGSALLGTRVNWHAVLVDVVNLYPRLFLGELIVGAMVVVGGMLFLIPGIYVGMRFIYYKQAIVFGRRPAVAALRESFRATVDWRLTLGLFACLAALYAGGVGLDSLLVAHAPGSATHIGTIAGTSLLLVWMNVLVTASYVDRNGEGEASSL